MRFQKKIMVLYVAFGLLAAVTMGSGYYAINLRQNLEEEYKNLEFMADQYEQQWDEYIRPMNSVMHYILSDIEMLNSIRMLAMTDAGSLKDHAKRSNAKSVLSQRLTTDYINKNFYRAVLFNLSGDITASNDYGSTVVRDTVDVKNIEWLSKVRGTSGKEIFLGTHMDDWGLKQQPEVFSVVKEIVGMNMGYIEVQRKVADLAATFQTTDDSIRLFLIDTEGKILYASENMENLDFYCKYAQSDPEKIDTITNTSSGKTEVLAYRDSKENGVKILVTRNLEDITKKSFYIIPITVLLIGGFFAFSLIYTWISSRQLTKPIRQMREFMDNTQFEDEQKFPKFVLSNDELEQLNQSYKDVIERLKQSIRKEKHMSYLQLQAQNDLLQAQINPHFIYNVLNVISSKGIEAGDDEICEICGCLAGMLRYSTSTKQRRATIGEELEYVEQYFYLQKSRYEYRLNYEIQVDEQIYQQVLPKIVLQQLVENSISHGYQSAARDMHISVKGGVSEENWYLEVKDDGDGFSDAALQQLREKMGDIRKKLSEEREMIEMEIGGMGVVNTYARLFLEYKDKLKFVIGNGEVGARIVISAPMK